MYLDSVRLERFGDTTTSLVGHGPKADREKRPFIVVVERDFLHGGQRVQHGEDRVLKRIPVLPALLAQLVGTLSPGHHAYVPRLGDRCCERCGMPVDVEGELDGDTIGRKLMHAEVVVTAGGAHVLAHNV